MRIRPLAVVALVGAFVAVASGQGQSLDWARRDGGINTDSARAIAVDGDRNSYVLGTFVVEGRFGAGEAGETVLSNAGAVASQDIYLAKYALDGTLMWALGIDGIDPTSGGDAGTDSAGGVAVDDAGGVYITGTLYRLTTHADLGNGVVLTQPGAFVARFDADGGAVWATSLDTSGIGWGIAVGADGTVWATGAAGEPGVGGLVPTTWTLDSSGTVLWQAQAIGGAGAGLGIAPGDAGTVRVAGRFTGLARFGAGQVNETTLTATNATADGFVAAYGSGGALLWARQTESDTGAWAEGLATDVDGNSYLTGAIHGSTTFGPGEPGATILAASNVGDAFVAKVGNTGSLVWARSINATANTYGLGITTDGSGSAYVTGFFGGSATFGAGEATEQVFGSLGSSDIFIAKYETNGGFEWAKRAGGATAGVLDEAGHGIALDPFANIHVTGFFTLATTFGEGEPAETSLKGDGIDAFVARYMRDDVPPPDDVDLDIAQFRTTGRVSVAKGGSVDLTLVVRNNGTVAGIGSVTVTGVQNGVVVYTQTFDVTDAPGGGRTTYHPPTFTPAVTGDITWTATLTDQDPDVDEVLDVTRVVG